MGTTVTMTLAEFAALPDEPGKCELLKGEVIRVPPPKIRHGLVQALVVEMLSFWAREHGGGRVLTNVGFLMSDDTCLEPDVAFVRDAQLAQAAPDDWFQGAPALAVEILSPSNSASRMEGKVQAYLDAGAELIWVFDPKRKRLTARYRDGETIEVHGEIANCPLFPGLRVPLASLFE